MRAEARDALAEVLEQLKGSESIALAGVLAAVAADLHDRVDAVTTLLSRAAADGTVSIAAPSVVAAHPGLGLVVKVRVEYSDGTRGWVTQPLVGFDAADGCPLVASVPATRGRMVRADSYGSLGEWKVDYVDPAAADPDEIVAHLPGTDAPVEMPDGSLRTVPAWGVTRAGKVVALANLPRPVTRRTVERDQAGEIVGVVEES